MYVPSITHCSSECFSERGCHGGDPLLAVAVAVVRIFDWGAKAASSPCLHHHPAEPMGEAEAVAPAPTATAARLARRLNEFPGARRQMTLFRFAGGEGEAPFSPVPVLFLLPPGACVAIDCPRLGAAL